MSTTAIVLIGHSHNLSGEMCPTHMVRLVESSRAAWTMHPLLEVGEPTVWLPYEPDRIFADLLGFIGVSLFEVDPGTPRLRRHRVELRRQDAAMVDLAAAVVWESEGLALSASLMEGSSLHRWCSEFMAMENADVELLEPSWSRKYNQWGGEWIQWDRNVR